MRRGVIAVGLLCALACGGDDDGAADGASADSGSGDATDDDDDDDDDATDDDDDATDDDDDDDDDDDATGDDDDDDDDDATGDDDDDDATGDGGSIRFFGNGGLYGDRVLIELDDPITDGPGPTVDVGDEDFTIELWIRPEPEGNANPAIGCGSTNDWVTSNIIVDRDRHSQPPSFGIGIAGGVIIWAVQGEAGDPWSMCGTADVLDGQWHHVAVMRRRSDGWLWLYVDGVLDAEVDGPDGDVSYPDDGVPMKVCPGGLCDYSDPFLAIGAEKHGYEGISYDGLVDELRLSTTLRYDADFPPPTEPFAADRATVGLYHFDDAAGATAATDAGTQDGVLVLGGDPRGPQWSAEEPW